MARTGGSGRAYVFRLSDDHSKLVKADGTTEVAALADAVLKLGDDNANRNIIVQTDFTMNEDGSVSCKIGQTKFDSAFKTFQDMMCPRKASAGGGVVDEELTGETGFKIGGGASVADMEPCVLVNYGSKGDDNKVLVEMHPGYFKKTTGTRSYAAGKFVAPPLEFQSIAAKVEISLLAALFDTEVVTAPVAAVAIPVDFHEHIEFMDPAA